MINVCRICGRPHRHEHTRKEIRAWEDEHQMDLFDNLELKTMNFGEALIVLEHGGKVARTGWNGKGMFLYLVQGSRFAVSRSPLLGIFEEGTMVEYRPHIDMITAQGDAVPWVSSQTDLLAKDWVVVE